MNTPKRISLEQFMQERAEWGAEHCVEREDGVEVCAECGAPIEEAQPYISLHDARFGEACAGCGQVLRLAIPYCPSCEEIPAASGCLHVDADARPKHLTAGAGR
jgi:hypothetical protein